MNPTFRKQILREFPELAAGYHLPVMAEVMAVADAPKQGGINDNYRPRLAVDVVLLNNDYESTGIILNAVPVAIMGGGNERGFFAAPHKNTLVELAWLNASPERPFVRSILGDRQALPEIDQESMSWQQNNQVKQSIDSSGNWTRQTDTGIKDKSFLHETDAHKKIEMLGDEIKRVLQHSIEDIDGIKQIEASAIHQLSLSVINLLSLGSINQVSGDHITRSANKNIVDNATANIEQSAENIRLQAVTDIEQIAAKLYLGTNTDNLLKLLSDFMQAVQDGFNNAALLTVVSSAPGVASSAPVNALSFTNAVTSIGTVKIKLDSMTK